MSASRGGETVDPHALRLLTWMVGVLLTAVLPAVAAGSWWCSQIQKRVESLEKAQCPCRDVYQTVPGRTPDK